MNYKGTRDATITTTAAQAIVQGISKDGGLFVPETLPSYSYADLVVMKGMSYIDELLVCCRTFLPEFSAEEIKECVSVGMPRKNSPVVIRLP